MNCYSENKEKEILSLCLEYLIRGNLTWFIELEARVRGINGNGNGSNGGHGLLQGVLRTTFHIDVAGAGGPDIGRVVTALSILNRRVFLFIIHRQGSFYNTAPSWSWHWSLHQRKDFVLWGDLPCKDSTIASIKFEPENWFVLKVCLGQWRCVSTRCHYSRASFVKPDFLSQR